MSQQRYLSREGRRRLQEAARRNRPWEHATGPKTPEGKARSAKNSRKHGLTSQLRLMAEYRLDVARWLAALDLDEAHQEIRQAFQQARAHGT